MIEEFGGARVHYPPGAFGQSNLDVAQDIIAQVRADIPAGARVAEFYAGVGAIGLSVLGRFSELRLNEASPDSLRGLDLGLAELENAARARISVFPGPAGAALAAASGADVVIADPPRKGLDPDLLRHLGEHPPGRLLYVSCGLESFLSDAAHLLSRRPAASRRAHGIQPDALHRARRNPGPLRSDRRAGRAMERSVNRDAPESNGAEMRRSGRLDGHPVRACDEEFLR